MVGQTLSPKVQLNHLEVRIGRKVARHRYLFGPPNDLFGLKTGLIKFKGALAFGLSNFLTILNCLVQKIRLVSKMTAMTEISGSRAVFLP